MLYQIYEAQRNVMEPFAEFAQAASKLYSNPLTPWGSTPFAQRVSASYDLAYRLWKDYGKPAWDISAVNVNGVEIAIHDRATSVLVYDGRPITSAQVVAAVDA